MDLMDEITDLQMLADDMLDSERNEEANKMIEYLETAIDYLTYDRYEEAKEYVEKAKALVRA